MFREMVKAFLYAADYPHAPPRFTLCFYGQIKGVKLPLANELRKFMETLHEKLCGHVYEANERSPCDTVIGRNLLLHIHGECSRAGTQESAIQRVQHKLEEKSSSFSYMQILSGESITDKLQVQVLTNEQSQISSAVYRLLDELRPNPLESIVRTPDWLVSAYKNPNRCG